MKSMTNKFNPLKDLRSDVPASIVVFLVAMPLCLGIALASGAPLFSGLIAGIIGGIVVGTLSRSSLGVSGPAAGLAVIVFVAIEELGGFEIFLVAVVLAGIIQLIMGLVRGGIIAYFFPSSVILGMLSGIGIIIFIKQIPHAFGYDGNPEGDFSFSQVDGQNTFSELWNMLEFMSLGAIIISVISLAILLLWETKPMKQHKGLQLIPGPLVAVVVGTILNVAFSSIPDLMLSTDHIVKVPVAKSIEGFLGNFTLPDYTALANPQVYVTALVIAVVASLETLLCVEAADKLDPYKRVTPTNRELKAQGVGNIISGLIGGLPITQVIVRSSVNVQSGGKTKLSTIIHGTLILASVVLIPDLLNLVPLATLAAILLVVGYKLATPSVFRKMYRQGRRQFIPFIVTVFGIVFTDLLMGLGIGLVVAIFFILYNNYRIPFILSGENIEGKRKIKIELAQEVTFLNKASILKSLAQMPFGSTVEIDASKTSYMDFDVLEIIENFKVSAKQREINLTVTELYAHKKIFLPSHITIKTIENGKKTFETTNVEMK